MDAGVGQSIGLDSVYDVETRRLADSPTLVDMSGRWFRRAVEVGPDSSSAPRVMGSKRGGGPLVSVGEVAVDSSMFADVVELSSGAMFPAPRWDEDDRDAVQLSHVPNWQDRL